MPYRNQSQHYFGIEQLDQRILPGLVGGWFGGGSGLTLFDWSGKGNHGTLTGGPGWTLGVDGNRHALNFDGSDDFVDLPDTTMLDGLSALSIASRFTTNTTAAGRRCVFGKYGGTTPALFLETDDVNGADLEWGISSTAWFTTTSAPLSVGPSFACVCDFDNARGTAKHRVYINGISQAGSGADGETSYANVPANDQIGRLNSANGRYWNGTVEYVLYYELVLSEARIALLADPAFPLIQPVIHRRWRKPAAAAGWGGLLNSQRNRLVLGS